MKRFPKTAKELSKQCALGIDTVPYMATAVHFTAPHGYGSAVAVAVSWMSEVGAVRYGYGYGMYGHSTGIRVRLLVTWQH